MVLQTIYHSLLTLCRGISDYQKTAGIQCGDEKCPVCPAKPGFRNVDIMFTKKLACL